MLREIMSLRIYAGDALSKEEMNTDELVSLIHGLIELDEWERANSTFFQSVTSRYLYFKIAERSVIEGSLVNRSLKDLYQTPFLSEKALRIRLREFERDGVIESVQSGQDKRSRFLMPSEKFYESVYLHAEQAKRIFSERFYLIKK